MADGGVTPVGQEEARFLHITQDLWDSKASGGEKGMVSWSFTITFPNEVTLPESLKGKQAAHMYPLPPSFSERASPIYIDYKLVVTVRRGLFKVNHTLAVPIVYVQLSRADPPSPLRQVAYTEGTAIIGPDGDPEGWKTLSPVKIIGTLFKTRQIELQCTLSIAMPVTYAKGSPIPLFLTLASEDEHALDILSAPTAARLYLIRVRTLGSHATDEAALERSDSVFRESVGQAYFWVTAETAPEPGKRTLQGEVRVKPSVKPSFTFPQFTLRYQLALFPFQAPGFVSSGAANEHLLTEKVIITTVNTPGIIPRSYAPPGYVAPEETDYNATVGFLENGNQRFLHHAGEGVS
ncbi:hypothetical protein SCP_1201230 [Sparassis crispa]|uniref:Arrestin-like N-terminal domain-containing protein n=1 Tax=Sparassis crispa TaxID=139825 RepID=A0A401H0F9_9APHY|nr:hypothetical protein SCP_1201230 [Sparassis crispa]GBE87898.1 hypothetical protein SCP_1201230 [Sparassis crispa]